MKESKISVIVPAYNVEKYIDRCIHSIQTQTYKDIEIIIVDDGSNDNTFNICKIKEKKDKRIVVIHTKNNGPSAARNIGIQYATGDYLFFVDSDDFILSCTLEILLNDMKKYNTDISICAYKSLLESEHLTENPENINGLVTIYTSHEAIELLVKGKIKDFAWAKLFKKHVLDGIKFPLGKTYEDIYVMHKLFERAKIVSIRNSKLYGYIQRNNSITGNTQITFNRSHLDALMYRYNDLKEHSELVPYITYDIAIRYLSILKILSKMSSNDLELYTKNMNKLQKEMKKYFRDKKIKGLTLTQKIRLIWALYNWDSYVKIYRKIGKNNDLFKNMGKMW